VLGVVISESSFSKNFENEISGKKSKISAIQSKLEGKKQFQVGIFSSSTCNFKKTPEKKNSNPRKSDFDLSIEL